MLIFYKILIHKVLWDCEVLLQAIPMQTMSLFTIPQLQLFCVFTVLRCGISGKITVGFHPINTFGAWYISS